MWMKNKLDEKKPNMSNLTGLKSKKKKKLWNIVANIEPSSRNLSSYPTGATDPKPMILWPYKKPSKWASTCQYYKYILGRCWFELTELY